MWSAILLAVALLALPATAGATAPRQIYADFAAHGKLQGHYTRSQLEAALRDAIAEGYAPTRSSGVKAAVYQQLHATPAAAGGTLPFTGADLTLIALGGGGLLLLGGGLRRLGRGE
jgi:hypothetical protein